MFAKQLATPSGMRCELSVIIAGIDQAINNQLLTGYPPLVGRRGVLVESDHSLVV